MPHLPEQEPHDPADINQSVSAAIETAKRISTSPAQEVFGGADVEPDGTVYAEYDTNRYRLDPVKPVNMVVDHAPADPSLETYVGVKYLNEKGGHIQYGADAKGGLGSMSGYADVLRDNPESPENPYTHAFMDKNKDRAASLIISLANKRINKHADKIEEARKKSSEEERQA